MKITMYELLDMIKNNKNLPKKIKYGNDVYVLQENPEDYATWLCDNIDLLNDVVLGHFNVEDAIYLELEIIEDTPKEQKKIPEKLKGVCYSSDFDDRTEFLAKNINALKDTINEIIDYLKSKGE